jgi:hypothetical protein
MRVMDAVDEVARRSASQPPSHAIYERRTDLPAHHWGGANQLFFPHEVRDVIKKAMRHDEL